MQARTNIAGKATQHHASPCIGRATIRRGCIKMYATAGPELDDKEKVAKGPLKAPTPGSSKAPQTPMTTKPGTDAGSKSRTSILVGKALDAAVDAATDIGRHIGRQLSSLPTSSILDDLVKGAGGKLQLKRQTARPVVLLLGSGWAAHSCIKVIDTEMYDVLVVSPRNFFCFTPMLPSTAVGTVEFRSLLEPIRTSNEFVSYLEASCDLLDINKKVATCTAANTYMDGYRPTFEVPYDILIVSVGEQPATFGVPGVSEHCCFMKEISDTVGIRYKIGQCFELAALPGTSEEARRSVLHFVVVGGGPTGVEFAGTLSDYVRSDLRKKYPQLMSYVRVSLLQSAQTILTQFDDKLANQAMDDLRNTGVTVRTGVRVIQVTDKQVVLKGGERMDYGICVWSCGNAARPLVQSIVDQVEDQAAYQKGPPTSYKLAVDRYLRVVGARDVLALGDCSLVVEDPLPATAQVAAQQGAYLAHLINRGYSVGRGGLDAPPPCRPAPQGLLQNLLPGGTPQRAVDESCSLDGADGNSCYAARAQDLAAPGAKLEYFTRPFEFLSLGLMAYIGDSKAAIDTQIRAGDVNLNLYGGFAFLLWRSVYITKQVSFRNRVLILFDWIKAKVFGRDLSMF